MEYPRNRPRVFLSHSKADVGFIEKVRDDLRDCQIDPWLDSQEIRPGQPWLDAIFESGIPTCDCVLVYLTERSIESNMVKKEIDASLIRKLKDKQVAFLPYVSRAEVRDKLRTDIQALQVPEWNENNYHLMLPRVVAEIWHSYMDRRIIAATSEERVKRLEAELLLKEVGQRIFSEGEDKDFTYIHKSMDRWEAVIFKMTGSAEGKQEVVQEVSYSFNVLAVVLSLVRGGNYEFYDSDVYQRLIELSKEIPEIQELQRDLSVSVDRTPKVAKVVDELQMFGLIQRTQVMDSIPQVTHTGDLQYHQRVRYLLEFTGKMQRFRYWLAVNEKMPQEARLQPIKPFERTRP